MSKTRPVAERIHDVLAHLGISGAHFASALAGELLPLVKDRPERFASLTLVNPNRLEAGQLEPLRDRLAIVTGSRGLPAQVVDAALPQLPDASVVRLADYYTAAWTDVVAERQSEVEKTIRDQHARQPVTETHLDLPSKGEHAGISYRCLGRGPALVLLPLLLSPSQWEPALDSLAKDFSVVVLGGPHLGMVAMLESRGSEPGYQRAIRSVFDELRPAPGETILEVGCGTGVLARWICEHTQRKNPVLGTDLNPYFLSEAQNLATHAGLGDVLEFREGNAEALPLDDNTRDVTFSSTVMEECDADKMLAELIRVTRPGGRIGVVVRATDAHNVCNLELSDAMRAKVEAPYRSVGEKGCADATLYDRFRASGLQQCEFFPHLLTLRDPNGAAWAYREPFFLAQFSAEEAETWAEAKRRAIASDTFVFASGLHCAVGTKPA